MTLLNWNWCSFCPISCLVKSVCTCSIFLIQRILNNCGPSSENIRFYSPIDGIRLSIFLIMCTMNNFGECRRKMAALFYSSLSWEIYWSDLFLLDRFICSIQAWQDTEYQVDMNPKLYLAAPQVSNELVCEVLERKGPVMYKGSFFASIICLACSFTKGSLHMTVFPLYIWMAGKELYFHLEENWKYLSGSASKLPFHRLFSITSSQWAHFCYFTNSKKTIRICSVKKCTCKRVFLYHC